MFPSKETVSLFVDMTNRDGFSNTVISVLSEPINKKYSPVLGYLKSALRAISKSSNSKEGGFCEESFASGFLSCFHLFRLQLESEDMEDDDLICSYENLSNYVKYLEEENVKLKDKIDGDSTDIDTKL